MKKILCFLLCLMMIVPSVVSLAENPPISSITINVTVPAAGGLARDQKNPTEPSGANYFVADCYWMKKSGSSFMDMEPDDMFEEGQDYLIDVHVIAESGYEFDQDVVVSSNVSVKSKWLNGDCFVTLQFTAQKKASEPAETASLSKLKSVKLKALSAKKLQVSWKKLSSKEQKKIQKIQIQYSTDKNFKTGVKTINAKKTKSSYIIKGLKKNTKYWVRIRAYKKEGNIVYVSKWVTKNKKTKKK